MILKKIINMKKLHVWVAAATVAILSSCAAPRAASINNEADLYRTWRLVELEGHTVDTSKLQRPAELTFIKMDNRVYGSAGCNTLSGKFTIGAPNKMTFSPIAATRMACKDMSTEDQFLRIAPKVNAWTITADFLVLSQDNTPLARFKAKK